MAQSVALERSEEQVAGIRSRSLISLVSPAVDEVETERSFTRDLDEKPSVFAAYMFGWAIVLVGLYSFVSVLARHG